MTIRLQRFEFGTLRDFRGPLVHVPVVEEVVEEVYVAPPPPVFGEEDVEIARAAAHKLGHAEGYQAGLTHAAEQADAKRVHAEKTVSNLSGRIDDLQYRYQELLNKEANELSQLVLMIARKISGVALDAHGSQGIAALVERCLPIILSKPQLIVELNPEKFESTMDHIESLLHASGFEGQVQFRTNPALGTHDAVLDWNAGLATRNTAELWQEIETLLASMPIALEPLASGTEQPTIEADQNGLGSVATTTTPTA